LQALYSDPHPDLIEALRHGLDAFLVELGPDPATWGRVRAPVETLGVALAALNGLAPAGHSGGAEGVETKAEEFAAALVDSLPPAGGRDAALAYHAVLRGVVAAAPGPALPPVLHALLARSPLTALAALDRHTPAALDPLAAELLPGWQPVQHPGGDAGPWLDGVAGLLAEPRLARWVRQRWLALPETRRACRNTGLLLEALRRRGGHRDFVLEFYEAYVYFRAETRAGARAWPVLETAEKLLRVPGDDRAALHLNRRGNEYFLKFRPLVEILIEEGGLPADYDQLSLEFVLALRRLLPYVTEGTQQRVAFGQVEFEAPEAS
jgi:hypothetical protein